ncbi:MAG: hypothetical protein IT373_21755 [Polyangiaceae bacterium]|nr:hypothetical protein [Polyangiaceae bacterium]
MAAVGCNQDGGANADNPGACGNLDFSAFAECHVEVSGGCTLLCEPVSFKAECYADCSGGCNVNVNASCTTTCQGGCEADCNVNPPSFDCEGSCTASCSGNCGAQCSAAANQAECQAACQGTCEGDCHASCTGTPGSADCAAKCEASCEGECTAEANMDCEVNCQGNCMAELTGGCEGDCTAPEGALFCDGQYVDVVGSFEDCIASLEAMFTINIDASGSASCKDGKCSASGVASCAVSPGSGPEGVGWLAAGIAAVGLGLGARRRRG